MLSRAHGTFSSRNAISNYGFASHRRSSTAVDSSKDTNSHRDATIASAQRLTSLDSLVTEYATTRRLQLPVRARINVSAVARMPTNPATHTALPKFIPSIGQTFEFHGGSYLHNGQFIRVREISQDPKSGLYTLIGWVFRRIKRERELVDFHPNELILLNDDARTQHRDCWQHAALREVVLSPNYVKYNESGYPVLRKLVITNILPSKTDPKRNGRERRDFHTSGTLTCRWRYTVYDKRRWAAWPREFGYHRFSAEEADSLESVPDAVLEQGCRGSSEHSKYDDLEFADIFCGAGGLSDGAQKAGLRVKHAVDNDKWACKTFTENCCNAQIVSLDVFRGMDSATQDLVMKRGSLVWQCAVSDFIKYARQQPNRFKVDVVHCSPPCTYFSQANWNAGEKEPGSPGALKDDEAQAALYVVGDVLDTFRSKVMTLEQTWGILKPKHMSAVRSLVRFGADRGYSVTVELVCRDDYGAAHKRARCIVIYTCPGLQPMKVPDPTHGNTTGRRKTTINDAIRGVDNRFPDHVPNCSDMGLPSDGDRPLKNTITTNGSLVRHPTGRPFTIRELRRLQSVDDAFIILPETPYKRTLLGNMVLPIFAKCLMDEVVRSLKGR